MKSEEKPLRLIEVEHVIEQFNHFIQRGEVIHIGGEWFAQEFMYHVHRTITAGGNSSFELALCECRNGVYGCGVCYETAPAFVQLWAKLNPIKEHAT